MREELLGRSDDLRAGAAVDLAVLGGCGIFHSFGLHQFGLGERRMDVDESVALLNHVALPDIQFLDAPGELAGDAHGGGVGLTFEYAIGLAQEAETDYGENCHYGYHKNHGYGYGARLFFSEPGFWVGYCA